MSPSCARHSIYWWKRSRRALDPGGSQPHIPSSTPMHDTILIVDFGSQVTKLIARRVREESVYCEIVPFQKAEAAFRAMRPKGVILSGGPASVLDKDAPLAPMAIYQAGVPVLGICYGEQAMAQQLGGKVEGGHHREFGRAEVEVTKPSALYRRRLGGRPAYPVWMSHGDRVTKLPAGFAATGTSANAPDRHDRRREAQILRHAIPSRSHAHAAWRGADPQFRAQDRRLHRRLDHAGVQGRGDRKNPPPGRQGQGDLRAFRRRRFRRRRGADPRGDRRPAHLRVRRSRPVAARRRRTRGRSVPRPLQHSARACRTPRSCSSRRSTGVDDPEAKAQDHRQAVHRRVRGRGEEDRRRRVSGPGHALSRRDRERVVHRRPVGDDQIAPQCRRLARAHEHEARRAVARIVQGRGARARPRARPAGRFRRPPSVSRARSRHPLPRRRSPARSSTSCASPTRSSSRKSAAPASTTRSGRPSRCCCRCAPSA